MPPRRRTISSNRRPRVAGLNPAGPRAEEADSGATTVTDTRPVPVPETAAARRSRHRLGTPPETELEAEVVPPPAPVVVPDVEEDGRAGTEETAATEGTAGTEGTAVTEGTEPRQGLGARLLSVPVLAGALAVLVLAAVFFGVATVGLRSTPAAANTALTDVGATSEVASQLGDALEIVYSYDFARLDENERAARDVITTGFSTEFDRLFGQVRELAPQQQAVVSATVTVSAVKEISGDRAVLVAFMDQQATTVANAEQQAAAGRLTVTGERVDGRWRIAAVEVP